MICSFKEVNNTLSLGASSVRCRAHVYRAERKHDLIVLMDIHGYREHAFYPETLTFNPRNNDDVIAILVPIKPNDERIIFRGYTHEDVQYEITALELTLDVIHREIMNREPQGIF